MRRSRNQSYQSCGGEQSLTPMTVVKAVGDVLGTDIKRGDVLLVLGEIATMRGHYALADENGKVVWGYHPENFKTLDESEM